MMSVNFITLLTCLQKKELDTYNNLVARQIHLSNLPLHHIGIHVVYTLHSDTQPGHVYIHHYQALL